MKKIFNMYTEDAVACAMYLKKYTEDQTSINIQDIENVANLICDKLKKIGYQCSKNFSKNEFDKFLYEYSNYINYDGKSIISLKNSNIEASEILTMFNAAVLPLDALKIVNEEKNSILESKFYNSQDKDC